MAKKSISLLLGLVLFGLLFVVSVLLQELILNLVFVGAMSVAYTYIKKSNNLDWYINKNKFNYYSI